jgi:glycosyltransferase involved in cell wall biosynthesis
MNRTSNAGVTRPKTRLAFVVSHPIQYYAPLYRRLAQRDDLLIRVFFTWHAGELPVHDRGFDTPVAWDVAMTEGYDFEAVPNCAADQGTHRFFGIRNPSLIDRVADWKPDVAHVTGWAWASHLDALWRFRRRGIPTLFRGDSHLLDSRRGGPRWWIKKAALRRVFSWPRGFLVVGTANRAYYEGLGVGADRLFDCPHSIDVRRFAEPHQEYEADASEWRRALGVPRDKRVVLYAGKFEPKKRPLELMRAIQASSDTSVVLVLVGGGKLQADIMALAASNPTRFRVLPFQNQRRMPIVYRLGDVFVLPSAFGETWGLAVNEALACGRPVLVSDRVGCAPDVVDASCGRVFPWDDSSAMIASMREMLADDDRLRAMWDASSRRAWNFDIKRTEECLLSALDEVCTT